MIAEIIQYFSLSDETAKQLGLKYEPTESISGSSTQSFGLQVACLECSSVAEIIDEVQILNVTSTYTTLLQAIGLGLDDSYQLYVLDSSSSIWDEIDAACSSKATVDLTTVESALETLQDDMTEIKNTVAANFTTGNNITDVITKLAWKVGGDGALVEAGTEKSVDDILSDIETSISDNETNVKQSISNSESVITQGISDSETNIKQAISDAESNLSEDHETFSKELSSFSGDLTEVADAVDSFDQIYETVKETLTTLANKVTSSYSTWIDIVGSAAETTSDLYTAIAQVVDDGVVEKLEGFCESFAQLQSTCNDVMDYIKIAVNSASTLADLLGNNADLAQVAVELNEKIDLISDRNFALKATSTAVEAIDVGSNLARTIRDLTTPKRTL